MSEPAEKIGIQLFVEYRGHPGSNGAWLAMLVEMTAHDNFGVYLDFDNCMTSAPMAVPGIPLGVSIFALTASG